jgi:DnaJ-class molecular chaperone
MSRITQPRQSTLQACVNCYHGLQCEPCKGTGTRRRVYGTTDETCYMCDGTGKLRCSRCKGAKWWRHYENMYLCVGGPLHGEYRTNESMRQFGAYGAFNNSTYNRSFLEKMIWVHKSLLP